MKNFLKYLSTVFVLSFLCITGVFADTFNPTNMLQYYEYYENGTKQEKSIQYGNNIYLSSEYDNVYPYAMSLILYGNYIQDKTYTINVNVNTRFVSNHFKFYYENLNYLIVSAQLVSGSERTLCNLQSLTQNEKYSIGCTFTPSTNLSQVVVSLLNYDYQNNGYVPVGSTDFVIFNNLNMGVYDNSSNIIIDQNNTIINQNNQNTQDIINNNNQNTQDLINSNKVCTIYDRDDIKTSNKYLNSSGQEISSSGGNGITDYINITGGSINVISSVNNNIMCFYTINKDLISCVGANNYSQGASISIPSNSSFVRFTISNSTNLPQFNVCINGNQAVDNTLNDDDTSGASDEASEFFGSFNTETFGLTSIITAPLNLIQSVLSTSCTDLQLPLPYLNNQYLTLPCMTSIYTQHFGTFFTIYQTITYGIIAYWVCVRIFNQVKDFKNPEHDEIEVMDL